jgi:hypothetical protein
MSHRTHPNRRARAARTAVAITALALVAAPAAPAFAATAGDGFVRFAHLSPDTEAVDLTLTSLAGDEIVFTADGIGYGAVSGYLSLDPGTYAVALVPSGEPRGSTPVLSGEIEVATGSAATVAGIGPNAEIQTAVFEDDFEAPSDGTARVRVINASALADSIDASTADGTELASDAVLGDVGEYTDVPAGDTEFSLTSSSTDDVASADLTAGSVHTMFVVDEADGALTVMPALDSASAAQVPIGGVDTGGGAIAAEQRVGQWVTIGGVAAIAAAALALILVRVRKAAQARS